VLFAITAEDRDALIGRGGDDVVTEYVSDAIKERWEGDDLAYTWDWFQGVRDLWRGVATSGRAVIFTVDQ
jgi:hypothetical protein